MLEDQLREVPFFGTLSKKELAAVARQTDEIDVREGEDLAREGDIGKEFFVIVEGTAEVVRGADKIAELGPGEFFGEMALVSDDRRNATVRATKPMRVIVMSRQSFREIDRSMPQVHSAIVKAIEARRSSGEPAAAG
jgi:CRP/FNR family transcriptional regulator, cyclic AMP receptor protein